MTTRRYFISCGLSLLTAGAALAQRAGWEFLGVSHVDGAVDHDKIKMPNGLPLQAINIRVRNNGIKFDHVVVHYADGDSEPIQIRNFIPAGGQTRVIDLPGGRRVVRSVEFWYERANFGGRRPEVRLWGMRG